MNVIQNHSFSLGSCQHISDLPWSQVWRLLTTVFAIMTALVTISPAMAMEIGQYEPPSLNGYVFERSWTVDADQVKDGIRETTIEKFVLDKRRVVLKWITNGKTWCWSVLGNYPDKSDNVNNYAIRDVEGKGIFPEKYPANEQFYLPAWIKSD